MYILAQQHQQQQRALALYPFCHISNMADKKVEETGPIFAKTPAPIGEACLCKEFAATHFSGEERLGLFPAREEGRQDLGRPQVGGL